VDGQHERLTAPFAQIGIADSELRVRPVSTLGIGLNDFLEVLAGGHPLLRIEGGRSFVEQELVRLERAGRNRSRTVAGTGARASQRNDEDQMRRRRFHDMRSNHLYSAASPSSRVTLGLKPRSARASRVSAEVCRISPFCAESTGMRGWRPDTRPIIASTSLIETREPPPILYTRPGIP